MKLEQKHLVPYSLCGLKMQTTRRIETEQGKSMDYWVGELVCVDAREGICNPISVYDDDIGAIDFELKEVKPFLHDLSSLTKEIEHNGERFVPDSVLYELFPYVVQSTYQEYSDLIQQYTTDGLDFCDVLQYNIINKLFEWHFNVFDLPKHLWINKNSLTQD